MLIYSNIREREQNWTFCLSRREEKAMKKREMSVPDNKGTPFSGRCGLVDIIILIGRTLQVLYFKRDAEGVFRCYFIPCFLRENGVKHIKNGVKRMMFSQNNHIYEHKRDI